MKLAQIVSSRRAREMTLLVPHKQLPALAVALEDARALGVDNDGVSTELLSCICDYLDAPLPTLYALGTACGATPPAEPLPPVVTGPGGDFVRPWPPDRVARELIGGDAQAAVAEGLPIVGG